MWVVKTADERILAQCVLCRNEEAFIHNWPKTEWANGPMEPVPMDFDRPDAPTTH